MLAVVRFIALVAAFLVINIVVFLVCVIRPFHRRNVHFAGQSYALMGRIMGLTIKLRVNDSVDTENTPYVFIANHQNSYDLITICKAALPGVVTVGKKSLKWIPIFGQIYWLSGNIMIDRNNSGKARDTLKLAARKMKEKKLSVWLFPEGTRSYGRGLLPFKVGAFKLAMETKQPLVMVTASTTHNKVKWNRWNNGTVIIDIDAPEMVSREKSLRDWMEYFHSKMEDKIVALDAEVASLDQAK